MISVELTKMKKNKVFIISSSIFWAFLILIMFTNSDLSLFPSHSAWLFQLTFVPNAVLMVMSVFVLTTLIQREYQDHTMINVLTAPVSRTRFITSKLFAWLIWHLVTLVIGILLIVAGYIILSESFLTPEIVNTIWNSTRVGLLSFVSMIPLIWVAILQRKTFFPTIILGLGMAIMYTSVADHMILNYIPWSAVGIIGIGFSESSSIIGIEHLIIGLTSIFATGILGLVLACLSFAKQDQ